MALLDLCWQTYTSPNFPDPRERPSLKSLIWNVLFLGKIKVGGIFKANGLGICLFEETGGPWDICLFNLLVDVL